MSASSIAVHVPNTEVFQEKLAKLNAIHDDPNMVIAEIYVITDARTNKRYVGQTVSHRLNHGRYRPYGFTRRYNSHLSQAHNNSPTKQVYRLQAAMREDFSAFSTQLVARCELADANDLEKHYVTVYNSLWPNGYNQTAGGKGCSLVVKRPKPEEVPKYDHTPRLPTDAKTEETRQKIGAGLRAYIEEHPEHCGKMTKQVCNQHLATKFKMAEDFVLNESFEYHLSERKNGYTIMFERKRDGKAVNFITTKTETREQTLERARAFFEEALRRQKERVGDAVVCPDVDGMAERKKMRVENIRNFHHQARLQVAANFVLDEDNLEQYIAERGEQAGYIDVVFERKRNGKSIRILAKGETQQQLRVRAMDFLKEAVLLQKQRTLPGNNQTELDDPQPSP